MLKSQEKIVLASASPRRQSYLYELGLSFEIYSPRIDESIVPGENPYTYVSRVAQLKVDAAMKRYPAAWIIAADTVVTIEGLILAKPENAEKAVQSLMRLSGNVHEVVTSFCLGSQKERILHQEKVVTKVQFFPFSEEIARAYVHSGEWRDKAGGYGIQGLAACLVTAVHGSYTNIVGLPLSELIAVMQKYGVVSV